MLLQETTRAWERPLRERLAAYPHVTFQHDARIAGGLAAFARAPIAVDERLPRAGGWFPAQRLVVGGLQVLHVHLQPMWDGDWVRGFFTTPPVRRAEIEAHWARMDPELPTIVAGDFNEEPGGQALAWLAERGVERVDTGPAHTWEWKGVHRGNPVHLRLRLDHVAIDRRLVARDARVLEAGASDHRAVVVELGIASASPRARR